MNEVTKQQERIIRDHERRLLTGVPRATWERYEKAGVVPRSVPLLGNTRGWKLSEIMDWVTSRGPDNIEAA